MKKIILSALVALGCVMGVSASTQYKVYDVKMSLKTTKAGGTVATACCDTYAYPPRWKAAGTVATACGDTYAYRVKSSRRIEGVIAGCGCIAMAGDSTCDGFETYFWDATTKTQLTNYTWKTKLLQRIDKTGKVVEQFVTFVVEDQDGEKFELMLAGFGTYSASKKGTKYDTISVNGGVTGIVDAPYKMIRGSRSACGQTPDTVVQTGAERFGLNPNEQSCACGQTPDTVVQTQAAAVCEDGICTEFGTSDVTPVYGSYSIKYNKSKSAKAEKSGATTKTLGLPSYVKFAD